MINNNEYFPGVERYSGIYSNKSGYFHMKVRHVIYDVMTEGNKHSQSQDTCEGTQHIYCSTRISHQQYNIFQYWFLYKLLIANIKYGIKVSR